MGMIKDPYGFNIRAYPGGVCGASYTAAPKNPPRTAGKGIRYFDGKVGKEKEGPKIDIKHVETQHGWITIMVQHEW